MDFKGSSALSYNPLFVIIYLDFSKEYVKNNENILFLP